MDLIIELKQLHETVGIEEYHKKFGLIRTRLQLSEEYLVNAYLAGLQNDTQINVRMFHPQSIQQCFLIGRLYEKVHPRKTISYPKQIFPKVSLTPITQLKIESRSDHAREILVQENASTERNELITSSQHQEIPGQETEFRTQEKEYTTNKENIKRSYHENSDCSLQPKVIRENDSYKEKMILQTKSIFDIQEQRFLGQSRDIFDDLYPDVCIDVMFDHQEMVSQVCDVDKRDKLNQQRKLRKDWKFKFKTKEAKFKISPFL